jgi:lipopolysaccharide export system protein LptC
MNERFAAWFPLLLLAVLAALTFWLDRVVQPDYIVERLSATRMDPAGRVKHTLFAEKMTHYADDDSTVLQSPRFTSSAAGRAPVNITSREALISSNGENIYFIGEVRVVRAAYADKSELVVKTDYLHVIPDDDIARTDREVTIADAHTVVTAVGLELNNQTRVLKLLSRVRGTYHDPDRNRR